MSRHRESLAVHYGADDFRDRDQLTRTLGRERAKDTTLDFRSAARLGGSAILVPGEMARPDRAGPAGQAGRGPSRFAGFKPKAAAELEQGRAPAAPSRTGLQQPELAGAARGYARAFADMQRMRGDGLPVLPHQQAAFQRADKALRILNPEVARDLRVALSRQPVLAARRRSAGRPGPRSPRRSATSEAVRLDPELRADRFVENWTRLKDQHAQLTGFGNKAAREAVEGRLTQFADGLGRDPPDGIPSWQAAARSSGYPTCSRAAAWPRITLIPSP